MEDEAVANFIAITGAAPERALQYLTLSDNNLQQAIELFYNSDGINLGETAATPAETNQAPPVPSQSHPSAHHDVINLDSDEEDAGATGGSGEGSAQTPATFGGIADDDDAAMARRLQEEFYGGTVVGGGLGSGLDAEGYRAPIAPTRETLVGPGSYDMEDPEDRHAAVLEQMQRRRRGMIRYHWRAS